MSVLLLSVTYAVFTCMLYSFMLRVLNLPPPFKVIFQFVKWTLNIPIKTIQDNPMEADLKILRVFQISIFTTAS